MLLLGLLLGLGLPAAAQTRQVDLSGFYRTDLRALAMGNAFGALTRGESALLYNPAGLVQYDSDIALQASLALEGETGSFFDDTRKQLTGSPSATDVQNYLAKYLGTTQYYRGQTFYNGVANLAAINIGLGAGVMDQVRYRFQFNDNGTPGYAPPDGGQDTLTLQKDELKARFYSFGFQVAQGKLLLGITRKDFTYSEQNNGSPSFDSLIAGGKVDTALSGPSYDGSSYDVGMIYRVEWLPALRPQWSLTALNAGASSLKSSDPTAPALSVPTSYNLGISFSPDLPWSPVHLLVSAELEDVTTAVKVTDPTTGLAATRSSTQRLHYGAELGFWELPTGDHLLNARIGSNRGQLTYGYELNLWYGLRLLYTRYKEDFGNKDHKEVHSFQAYQLGLGFSW